MAQKGHWQNTKLCQWQTYILSIMHTFGSRPRKFVGTPFKPVFLSKTVWKEFFIYLNNLTSPSPKPSILDFKSTQIARLCTLFLNPRLCSQSMKTEGKMLTLTRWSPLETVGEMGRLKTAVEASTASKRLYVQKWNNIARYLCLLNIGGYRYGCFLCI